jgi:hypothetical protein
MEESAQPWITQDNEIQVKDMLSKTEKAKIMAENRNRYKIIADLMIRGSADITSDTRLFATVNRPRSLEDNERLCLEDYMNLFPEDTHAALEAAKQRRAADERDYNPHSMAKWRIPGYIPTCVWYLFMEYYPDGLAKKKAIHRFFNMFPKFRISSKPI